MQIPEEGGICKKIIVEWESFSVFKTHSGAWFVLGWEEQVANLVKLVDSRDIVELQSPPSPAAAPPTFQLPPSTAAPSAPTPSSSVSPSPPAAKSAKSSLPPLKCPMAGTFYHSGIRHLVNHRLLRLETKYRRDSHIQVMLLATTAYVLCIMGIISMYICEPPEEKCIKKVGAAAKGDWLTIISLVVGVLAIVIATFSTGIDSQCFQVQFKKKERESEDDVPYGFGFFHFVFATGAMYFAMLLIGWNTHHTMKRESFGDDHFDLESQSHLLVKDGGDNSTASTSGPSHRWRSIIIILHVRQAFISSARNKSLAVYGIEVVPPPPSIATSNTGGGGDGLAQSSEPTIINACQIHSLVS
ncbi:hypothetical protein TEA_010371 [Camellia sinensis var. sinensis]|uniref:Uncharacterized protein n=1 Tax=Camellia sinensis var. sinensis TaxID=542762 RepID=A0A4S4E5P9_CAMSN|nr:hypothetical protein TEA_010371 [Camellia sinensis var. sinensis]